MANYKKILIIFLVALAALIGTLGLFVVIGDWNANNNSEIPQEPEPEIENEVIEQPTKQIPEFKITEIELQDGCKIRVKTSLDGIFPERRNVRISVSGRNEPTYQSHGGFNASNIRKLDIWAIYGNDTIPYEGNGKEFRGKGCP